MNAAALTQLLYGFIVLSALLLVGTLLRALIPAFQKCFLPASVIGGFIGLLLGPMIWQNWGIPFPEEWVTTWAALPGILIVPVVASVPLGMKFGANKSGGGGGGGGRTTSNVLKMFLILFVAGTLQSTLGYTTQLFFNKVQPGLGLYKAFGYELAAGYSGGHGTAGVWGGYLMSLDQPYWEVAQGVATTTATFGLVGGMILGIIYINIMARKGKTTLLKKPGDIPPDMSKGVQLDPAKQVSAGKDTTFNSSIESLTFHLSVILAGCGIAYVLMNLVKKYKVPLISQVPIWAYAIVVMFGVNYLINKLKLGDLIDTKTKSKIAGTLTDYAIVAAIASMPVRAVLQYVWPILVMCLLGYVVTFAVITFCCNRFFTDAKVERNMALWGSSTGVFLNGLMLLKICDPDYDLPVLNDYSIGFSINSITGFIMLPLVVFLVLNVGLVPAILVQLGLLLVAFLLLLGINKISKRPRKSEAKAE